VVDELAARSGAHFGNKRDLSCDLAKVELLGDQVVLVKPTTFMNLSGRAVQAVLRWFKVESEQMMIIHDDVSLPLGRIRLQAGGGAGGQHGIESVIQSLGGSTRFDRLKVGVGPDPGGDVRGDYVLSPFPQSDAELVEKVVAAAADAASSWLRSGIKEAMNGHNGINLAPAPPPPERSLAKNPPDPALGETPKPENF